MISVRDLLEQAPVITSAPCRIDSGGTWDIKAMALPFEHIRPVTLNMALDMRTYVILYPFDRGYVKISSGGFERDEIFPLESVPLDTRYAIFWAALSWFGFHGLEIKIRSQSPVKAALGGSSTALVALLKGLSEVASKLGMKGLEKREILHLAFNLEDAVSGGNCGMQDHAAAVFGGVNTWTWHYGNPGSPWERISLLDEEGEKSLSDHLIVAYSGKTHVSARTNQKWTADFLSGITRKEWIRANSTVHRLSEAIRHKDWAMAASMLDEEMSIRERITPEALIPITRKLIGEARKMGFGARFAGAGAGGSVWAIGEERERLRKRWEEILNPVENAMILDCRVDPIGVKTEGRIPFVDP